jgi:hypothetical protein
MCSSNAKSAIFTSAIFTSAIFTSAIFTIVFLWLLPPTPRLVRRLTAFAVTFCKSSPGHLLVATTPPALPVPLKYIGFP